MSDVEPDDPVVDPPVNVPSVDNLPPHQQATASEYRRKKHMSACIFRYFMEADVEQQRSLGIEVDGSVQTEWQTRMKSTTTKLKLDDLGDALLHALNELLCGSTNYRQLVPDTPSVHNNRTVVVAILPHIAYWVVVHCTWNRFQLEDVGTYEPKLSKFFKSTATQQRILDNLDQSLLTALTNFSGNDAFASVADIKIITKQLQGLKKHKLSGLQAGALTESTYCAMKRSAAMACNTNCQVFEKTDKHGHVYTRIDTATGNRVQVIRSAGKHLNAATAFLPWFDKYGKRVLKNRDANLNTLEKLLLFKSLRDVAASDDSSLCSLELSQTAKAKLVTDSFSAHEVQTVIVDLLLIAVNSNQDHMKAIAANSRKSQHS
jgi:hypothetical protein